MANEKISQMFASAQPLTGAEGIPLIQDQGSGYINVAATLFDAVTFAGFIFNDITYYASPTGNDANNGLTPSTPKTLQGALNMVSAKSIGDGISVTIQMADGTYSIGSSGLVLPYFYGPFGLAILQGNLSNKNAVVIDDTPGNFNYSLLFTGAAGNYVWIVQNFIIQRSNFPNGFGGFIGLNGGVLSLRDNMTFGVNAAPFGGQLIVLNANSKLSVDVSGTNSIYINCDFRNFIYAVGTGAFTYMVGSYQFDLGGASRACNDSFYLGELLTEGIFYAPPGQFNVINGSLTGVRGNFIALSAGKFYNSPNTNVLPGNSNMTTASGGQIV